MSNSIVLQLPLRILQRLAEVMDLVAEMYLKVIMSFYFSYNYKQRKHACENGLQISPTNVNGKCIILVDDSIVRGNTL